MDYIKRYLQEAKEIIDRIDAPVIDKIISVLKETRQKNGRLFLVGSGGGAGHASHAVCDFRKICGIESYCPTDNVSELTARINDDGWDTSISNYLKGSKLNSNDCVFVFSVGGGNEEKNISMNLVNAVKLAKERKAKIVGVVGRDGGYTARMADACVIIPTISSDTVTAHAESFQALVWHLIASHPQMKVSEMKWESTK